MTPVVPCSASNISFIPGSSSTARKNRPISRYTYAENPTKQSLSSQRFFISLPRTIPIFSQSRNEHPSHHRSRIERVSATGEDVAAKEQETTVADEASAEEVDANGIASAKSDVGGAPIQAKKKQGRKSTMRPVKDEDLVPGAVFTGKVRSIQPFGAFVDFGAFTDGLVHVSRLSDSFVKDVNDVVSLGQEVKVRIVEVNTEAGRISLSMRDDDESSKPQRKSDGPSTGSDKPRSSRMNASKPARKRDEENKASKFTIGQNLVGTVKNFGRSGAFVSLPEGEEGFLPTSEQPNLGLGNMMGQSSLQVGQEVNARVLRIARGNITLTVKEEDKDEFDPDIYEDDDDDDDDRIVTNPFAVAFRRDKDIAAFLDEREKFEKFAEIESSENESTENVSDVVNEDVSSSTVNGTAEVDASPEIITSDAGEESSILSVSQNLDVSSSITEEEAEMKSEVTDSEVQADTSIPENGAENLAPSVSQELSVENRTVSSDAGEEVLAAEAKVETSSPEGNGSITSSSDGIDEFSPQESIPKAISPALVKQLRDETGAGMMDCKSALSETGVDIVKAQEYLRKKGLASADKKSSRATAEGRIGSYIHDSRIGVLIEVNCETDFVSRGDIFRELVDDLAMQVAACPQVEYLSMEDVPKETVEKETEIEMQKEDIQSKPEQIRGKIVEGRVRKRLGELALLEQPYIKNDKLVVKDWVKQTIATIGENIKVKRFVKYNLGEGLEKKIQDFAAEVAAQTAEKPEPAPAPKEQPASVEVDSPVEKAPAAAVSAALVKQLREETGAGMMDCKKALGETGGNLEKAQEYLRKKGLSSADKKSSRLAAEGRIGSYIHDARIGVLIEVNCETDFVGRSENFKELVDDLAMQVAACPQVQYVSIDNIPQSIVIKEKEIEMLRENIQSKPENIREKIVEGRISKRLGELALLEQPFIKNDSILVKDLVKQAVASLGENIKVRRFSRFTLGEQTEDSNPESET